MNDQPKLPALMTGGNVTAIIPQSIEDMWRVGTMVVRAGLAPQSLTGNKSGDDAISAVCSTIMSGAELGLPPMVALRSFTVINGKPALYGDGIINVARRSGRAEYIRTGYLKDASDEALRGIGLDEERIEQMRTTDERTIGWCAAKRRDTGEEKVEAFSVADAKEAQLWDPRPTVRRKNRAGEWYEAKNDAPWHRYAKRMLAWRAAGFCLRELFADVLGGIRDEFETREIVGEYIDHGDDEPRTTITPPSPPKPPSPPSPTLRDEASGIDPIPENGFDKDLDNVSEEQNDFDYGGYFERLQEAMQSAMDEETVEEVWTDFDPEASFQDDQESMELAFNIKNRRLSQLNPVNAG